jgi:hypothetical protein
VQIHEGINAPIRKAGASAAWNARAKGESIAFERQARVTIPEKDQQQGPRDNS